MAGSRSPRWDDAKSVGTINEDDGLSRAERVRARLEVWNTGTLSWDRMTQPGAGGGGGGPATIADGADVAQGTTTDTSAANTVIGILKAIKAAVTGTLTVAAHNVTNAGTFAVQADTELPSAAALADTEANPTVPRVGGMGMLWNGATWDRVPGSAAAGLKVQSAQLPAALVGGRLSVDLGGQTLAKVLATVDPITFASPQHTILDSGTLTTLTGITNVVHVDDNSGSLTVDAPVGTPVFVRLSDGAAALVGQKVMASSVPVVIASDQSIIADNVSQFGGAAVSLSPKAAASSIPVTETASVLVGTTISGANATVTLTLTAVAAAFHYITAIEIVNINPTAAAIAGSAVTLSYTTTNLPGSLAWTCGNALAVGAEKVVTRLNFNQPLKSSVLNTATTIVAPAIGAGGLCRITVYYYTAA